MVVPRGRRALALALVGATLVGCSGSHGSTAPDAGAGPSDAPQVVADAGPDGIAQPSPADTGPPAEVGTFELPRTPADPRLTRKIVDGVAGLVGGDWASCTHAPGATSDRWCAFSKSLAPAPGTELWVINLSEAVRGAIPVCNGSSSACVKLTANLWTGTPLWGPFHPSTHRFEGDTLLYHADQAPGGREPYQGAVWAWRPGWAAPRKITGDRGLQCHVEHRSTAAFCLDNAVAERDPASPFDRPYLREFDLLAGKLDGAAAAISSPPIRVMPRFSYLFEAQLKRRPFFARPTAVTTETGTLAACAEAIGMKFDQKVRKIMTFTKEDQARLGQRQLRLAA